MTLHTGSNHYDGATRLWTTVLVVMIAGILDWFAVVIPSNFEPSHKLLRHVWWWGTLIAVSFPIFWLAGRILLRRKIESLIWLFILVGLIVAQLSIWEWGSGR